MPPMNRPKSDKNPPNEVKTASLSLGNGYGAIVALHDSAVRTLSKADWSKTLADPAGLLNRFEQVLKADGDAKVGVCNLAIGRERIAVVVKSRTRYKGPSGIVRSALPVRAVGDFRTARKLLRAGIATAMPLAAVVRKAGTAGIHSLFITEYIEGGMDLYCFFESVQAGRLSLTHASRRDLCVSLAEIFAGLHRAGLWHRDAKAGNFFVRISEPGRFEPLLVDMEGIKPYRFCRGNVRFRGLSKLAATLLWCECIGRRDYLRVFVRYAKVTGLRRARRAGIFRALAGAAMAIRLTTLAESAIRGSAVSTGRPKG